MSVGRVTIRAMTLWGRVRTFVRTVASRFSAGGYSPVNALLSSISSVSGGRVSRADALSVPAVQRGRNMLCSISTLPLVQYGPDNAVVRNPLLEQIDADVANVVTLAQTVEDLLFEGIAWWRITGLGFDRFPVSAQRIDPAYVSLTPPNTMESPLPSMIDPHGAIFVYVSGEAVPASMMIRFDSPNPPVLVAGARAIRRAILLEAASAMYADDPRPLDYFSPAEGADPITDEEAVKIIAQWRAARKKRATGWVPASMKYNTVDSPSPADLQLVELQKKVSLDLANALGLDPEDLGVSTTSRTYANAVDRRRDRINDVLAPLMRAITDRLSMGDVTKRGYRVDFDLDDYMKSNPTERWNTYKIAEEIGVMDAEEIRAKERMTPGAPKPKPAPAPPPIQATATVGDPIPELPAAASRALAVRTFSDAVPGRFVALELQTFSVDTESRTIEGVAVPYGAVGNGARFERGALKFSNVSKIKLNLDHDAAQTVGVATEIKDGNNGLAVKFRIARTPEGDRALTLAEDGVYDGLSVEIPENSPDVQAIPDPRRRNGFLIKSAPLIGVALTPDPAFSDARVTRVKFEQENSMPCAICGHVHAPEVACTTTPATPPAPTPDPATPPATPPAQFSDDQRTALLALLEPDQGRQFVNPTRPTATTVVREALPYRFQRQGIFAPFEAGDNVFSADLHAMMRAGDDGSDGGTTEAAKRVMGLLAATFARRVFVDSTNVTDLNPLLQRPDLYVDQRDFRYPIFSSMDRGAPPNGIQPFGFPKFSSSSNLVADHVQGTEPGAGTFVTTNQTITPTPVSGKARLTREVWDMGGNPAVSTLIFNQMVRGYREGLESAAATFLNTLTAATDINLNTGATAGQPPTDAQLNDNWENAIVALQFVRGYDFSFCAMEQNAYAHFGRAKDTTGRKLYPMINPTNADGQASPRFSQINAAGITLNPSWALPATPGSPNNSWLYDPSVVWGFSTPPQRLEFPGSGAANIYTPVAGVDLAIWGYKAFANTDIGGVRQIIYDTTT